MKKSQMLLALLMTLSSLSWSTGCGESEPEKPPAQQTEELRQKQIERAERMGKEA